MDKNKNKNKKKTLTISSGFSKKIDVSSIKKKDNKKSFFIEKKKSYKGFRSPGKHSNPTGFSEKVNNNKKNLDRKFIEQQATKNFIKKDDKKVSKNKLKIKGPVGKKDFKLTVSRALNVEEIEIKQRSLASVKRARLKEKRNSPQSEEKKEFKKVIRDVKIPEQISIQELSNRMAERSNDIIKFLFIMFICNRLIYHIIYIYVTKLSFFE